MLRAMRCNAWLLVLVAACGGAGGDDTADDDVVDDAGAGDDGGPAPDAAGPALPVCVLGCTVAADCATGAAGSITDADNYTCDDGVCAWRGCLSTQECQATFSSPDYVCEQAFGAATPTCWPTCDTAGDCALASVLYDADNYECSGNKCHWTGCNSTTECTTALGSADYTCEERLGVRNCWPTCTVAADCATASAPYDADNYACDDGVCAWQGCNSTAECMTIAADWVCR